MSCKPLCDRTRLWGDSGLRCQGWRWVCVRMYVCACALCYFWPLFPSLRFPYSVSERGCDPVWRNSLLGFLLSICWKITAQAIHLRRPLLLLLIPASIFSLLSVSLSIFITLNTSTTKALFCHFVTLLLWLSGCRCLHSLVRPPS